MSTKSTKKQVLPGGFTLMELLIVIAIIIVLAAAVFVALNPAKRFQDSRNARRSSDVSAILSALKIDQADNGGTYVASVAALTADTAYQIGTDASGCDSSCTGVTQAACADLTALATEGYLGSIPFDPSTGTAEQTDYSIIRRASGTITISACDAEAGAVVSTSR